MDTSTYQICQQSNGQEDDWRILYEGAFAVDDRMPVSEIRQKITQGTMLLHKTLNKSGECLCFSLTFPVSDFLLLSYLATDPTKRSGGVGSKHMKKLIEICKARNTNFMAMFLEIESTTEQGLDPATQKARQRRLNFYHRLGAKRLCKIYLLPSLTPGNLAKQGELLWFEFGVRPVDDTVLPRVIQEIYDKAYGIPATHPVVQKVLAQFAQGTGGAICPPPLDPNAGGMSGPSGAGTPPPPSGAGTPLPPSGAGTSPPSSGAGTPPPPSGAGTSPPSSGAGTPPPPSGAGTPSGPQPPGSKPVKGK